MRGWNFSCSWMQTKMKWWQATANITLWYFSIIVLFSYINGGKVNKRFHLSVLRTNSFESKPEIDAWLCATLTKTFFVKNTINNKIINQHVFFHISLDHNVWQDLICYHFNEKGSFTHLRLQEVKCNKFYKEED